MNYNDDILFDDNNYIISSYIDFVNNTSASLHSMIDIINSQQHSFNEILNRYSNNSYRLNQSRINNNNNLYNLNRQPRTSFTYRNHNNIYQPNNIYQQNRRPQDSRRQQENRLSQPNRIPNIDNIVEHLFRPTYVQIPNNLNEPVIIRPTNQQIRNATNRILFENIDSPINHTCPISQIDFSNNTEVIQLQYCKHIFMPNHILQWFQRNVVCPLCRHDIRITQTNDISNTVTNQNNNENDDNNNNQNNDTNNNENDNTNNENNDTYNNQNEDTNSNENRGTINTSRFSNQLASLIYSQLTSDSDFSGNINIELAVEPTYRW